MLLRCLAFHLQVVKKRLAVNQPTLLCGDFMYEEGEGLEEDEVEAFAALLPKPLAALPGGGVQHNSVLMLSDQSQDFSVQLMVAHRVGTLDAIKHCCVPCWHAQEH